MSQKRILITEVSGDCRNIRYIPNKPGHPDVYCAANPHSDWERIDPKECDTCKREKYLQGLSRAVAIECIAKVICGHQKTQCKRCFYEGTATGCGLYRKAGGYDKMAEAALDALLGKEV